MTSPLDILTAPPTAKSAPARVDADTFAKLCERPGAQRCILDGASCVDLQGVTYRHVDALFSEGPGGDDGDL